MNLNRLYFFVLISSFSISLFATNKFSNKNDFADEIANLQQQIFSNTDSPWIIKQSEIILATHYSKVNVEKLLLPSLEGCFQMAIMFGRGDLANHFFGLFLKHGGTLKRAEFMDLLKIAINSNVYAMLPVIFASAEKSGINLGWNDLSEALLTFEIERYDLPH